MNPRNIILYGPPGTGKTYRSSALAVQLIENLSPTEFQKAYTDRPSLRDKAEQYRREGRLALVVFHPSFAYEDFVEGIKPQSNEKNELAYQVEDGIFKQMSLRAAHALYLAQQKNVLSAGAPTRRDFEALFFEFVDYLKRSLADDTQETVFESKTGKPFYLTDINKNNTLSLKMSKGRKAYPVTKNNLAKLYRTFASAEAIKNLRRDLPSSAQSAGSVLWAVFNRLKHYEATRNQTYQYLLEGQGAYDATRYQAMKRDLRQLDYTSLQAEDYAAAGNFVLVIDEINRGNVAAIFGELIALLEDDKRAGQAEALQTVLPYSREAFSVPPNLFLVGTMNTADRSVEALDTALRRRFSFEAMLPDPTLLRPVTVTARPTMTKHAPGSELLMAAEAEAAYRKFSATGELTHTLRLERLLEVINQRLVTLLDADHQLGHGYLLPVLSANDPLDALREVFYRRIIPLLQEYFFSEMEKVMLVIGRDFFVISSPPAASKNFFAPSDSEDAWREELPEKKHYQIRSLTDEEFIKAIIHLYE